MSSTSVALSPLKSQLHAAFRRPLSQATLITCLLTIVLGWGALLFTHKAARPPLSRAVAARRVLASPGVAEALRRTHWQRTTLTPVDSRHELLGFFRGPRMVGVAILGVNGRRLTIDVSNLTHQRYAYGSDTANDVRLLAVLSIVFVLMTAVWPVWRLRNLDVLVTASLVLSIVLLNRWLLTPMVLVTYPALVYLALRCAWWGLGRRRTAAPSTSLFDLLTSRWSVDQRIRGLRLVTVALVALVVLVGLSSSNVLDVGYAVMEGATRIIHGVLPYGHIPDILHGDTYPIGSYLFYAPLAWLTPVHGATDNADATLAVAVVAALCAAVGLSRMLSVSSPGWRLDGQVAGLRVAITWLSFCPLIVTVSTGTTDVALAAMLVGGLLLWRRPGWSSAALSAAAWFKLAPVVLMPLLLARLRGRCLAGAGAAIVITSAIMVGAMVALGGLDSPQDMFMAVAYQFTRASPHTLWAVIGSVPLQQLAQAATLAFVVAAVLRLRREPALGEDRKRLAAMAGALLLGVQVSANYWNYMYLVWAFPFVALSLLAPISDYRRRSPNA
jgi:hypothetical protein